MTSPLPEDRREEGSDTEPEGTPPETGAPVVPVYVQGTHALLPQWNSAVIIFRKPG